VQIFTCAEAALAACSSLRYDVIISDYEMTGLNGVAFLRRLRSSGDRTPFILFTGRGREVVAIEALNSGADFYLQKGGDPKSQFAELVNMIRHLMQRTIASEEMMRVQHHYKTIAENLHDVVIITGLALTITSISLSVQKLLGVTSTDLIGTNLRSVVPQEKVDIMSRIIRTQETRSSPGCSGDVTTIETPLLIKGRSPIPGKPSISLIPGSGGTTEVLLMIRAGIFSDRSQEEHTTPARIEEIAGPNPGTVPKSPPVGEMVTILTHAEELNRTGSWHQDLETGDLWWSDGLFRIMGLKPGSVPPDTSLFWQIFHSDDWPALFKSLSDERSER